MDRIILWSGGFDSTYLIQKSIQQGYNVSAYYNKIKNNGLKVKMELNAINKMIPLMKKEYGNKFNYLGILTQTFISNAASTPYFCQMPLWINSLLYLPQSDSIAIGYCMNDDAISFLPEIKKVYNSYKFLLTGKVAKLQFPLSKIHKSMYIDRMKFKEYCVYCQNPRFENNKYINCDCCIPCKKYHQYFPQKQIVNNNEEKELPKLKTKQRK